MISDRDRLAPYPPELEEQMTAEHLLASYLASNGWCCFQGISQEKGQEWADRRAILKQRILSQLNDE